MAEKPKFTKQQARYRTKPLIMKCSRCKHFSAEEQKCALVSEAGEPSPGAINPGDGCRLWNAYGLRVALVERLVGRGA